MRSFRRLPTMAVLALSTLIVCCAAFLVGCPARDKVAAGNGARTTPSTLPGKPSSQILFLSTQLNPTAEAAAMRDVILKDFPGTVDFRPNNSSYMFETLRQTLERDPKASILLGGLRGEFMGLFKQGQLRSMADTLNRLKSRGFQNSVLESAKLDGENPYFVPWMQATYLFAASKKALACLPKGADPMTLTYDQLYAWAENIKNATGSYGLGFPASDQGLMHRFLQGYLYPSFTGSTLARFKTERAADMWRWFVRLWKLVDPRSLGYSNMSDPLLAGDVLIAWDHTARLAKAFAEKPDDFIAIPAPSGSAGRGYISVISGLAIPAGSGSTADPELLVDYLTDPVIQVRALSSTGFFPVVTMPPASVVPKHLKPLVQAVERQNAASDAVPTALPTGLGERGDAYNRVFLLAFSDIVLGGLDIRATLDADGQKLQDIVDEAAAPFWAPDDSGEKPGKLE